MNHISLPSSLYRWMSVGSKLGLTVFLLVMHTVKCAMRSWYSRIVITLAWFVVTSECVYHGFLVIKAPEAWDTMECPARWPWVVVTDSRDVIVPFDKSGISETFTFAKGTKSIVIIMSGYLLEDNSGIFLPRVIVLYPIQVMCPLSASSTL